MTSKTSFGYTELCDFKGNITEMASKRKDKKPKNK